MSYYFTRIASLVLAFGFFISCSTLTPTQNSNPDARDLSETELEKRVAEVSRQVSEGDSSKVLLYKRGLYLIRLAQKKSPSERTSLYTDARSSLKSLNRTPEKVEGNNIRELLNVSWSNEHNQGVKILSSDSTRDKEDYAKAALHFENATEIIPDSIISYKKGVQAYYRSEQDQRAINLLEKSRANIKEIPASLLEQLAFLYLETGQEKKAISVYEEAESFTDQNLNLLHGLSNAYIKSGKHEGAISLLRKLVDMQPSNISYRQSLASELYLLADDKIGSMLSGQSFEDSKISAVDSLLSDAEEHLVSMQESDNENMEITVDLANLYYNGASNYQQLLPMLTPDQQGQIKSKIKSLLSSSVPLLEKLSEKHPDQNKYRKHLYQAYSYLGMSSKAENVKSNL